MDTQTPETPISESVFQVDPARPFRSVKEAVAILGDRFLHGGIKSSPNRPSSSDATKSPEEPSARTGEPDVASTPSFEKPEKKKLTENPNTPTNPVDEKAFLPDNTLSPSETRIIASKQILESPKYRPIPNPEEPEKENNRNIVHGNDIVMMLMVLKKLEVDLQETKTEVKLLKERGSEMEVAIASLNAEFHKNMSKIAQAEAAEVAKAATKSVPRTNEGRNKDMETRDEERKKTDLMAKTIDSPTLAQILSISDYEGYFKENKSKTRKRIKKKKPIIPLVTDLFPWKKKSSPSLDISEPLFSKMYFT